MGPDTPSAGLGHQGPRRIDSRYLPEDVGYTLVFFTTSPAPWWSRSMDASSTHLVVLASTCAGKQPHDRSLALDRLSNQELLSL